MQAHHQEASAKSRVRGLDLDPRLSCSVSDSLSHRSNTFLLRGQQRNGASVQEMTEIQVIWPLMRTERAWKRLMAAWLARMLDDDQR